MNHPKMRKVIDEVFEELSAMPREQFMEEFENSRGDIAKFLEESGAMEIWLDGLISVDDKGEPTGKPITITIETADQAKNFIRAGIAGRESAERLKKMFGEKS